MQIRSKFFITLLALCLLFGNLPAHAQAPPPDWRFGAVESFRASGRASELGLGWERIIFFWSQIQRTGPEDWNEFHVEDGWIAEATASGRQVVGLLEGTPEWATDDVSNAGVPRGLYLPIDDPNNLWAEFVRKVVRRYAGRIDHWIIWNEPDIEPPEYGTQWAGTVADYVQLLKVAYQAAKQENPNVVIHFAGLTYWHDVVNRRPIYLQRFIDEARKDPDAAANNFFFDVVSLHIYFTTDSVYDITSEFAAILRRNGLSKPIWINETNAAPYDDPLNPWSNPVWQVTLDQQAGFVIQALALGLSAGAQRIAVYKLIDFPDYAPGFEPYGLVRSDGSARPAFDAMRVATTYMRDVQSAQLDRTTTYNIVTLNRGAATTRVMWARGKSDVSLSLPALAEQGLLVTHLGETQSIAATDGVYRLTLPAALCADPAHGCAVGGVPLLIVEDAPAEAVPPAQAATATLDPDTAATESTIPDPIDASNTPEATATEIASDTPTPTASATRRPTSTPTATATLTPTATASAIPIVPEAVSPNEQSAFVLVIGILIGAVVLIAGYLGARRSRRAM